MRSSVFISTSSNRCVVPLAGQKDLQGFDGAGAAQADFPPHARGAEAAAPGHPRTDHAGAVLPAHVNFDAAPTASRLDRTPSSSSLSQLLPWPGFSNSTFWVDVAGEGASHHREDLLVAVVIEIAEGDAVALLQMPEPPEVVTSWKNRPAALRNIRFGMRVIRQGSPVPR